MAMGITSESDFLTELKKLNIPIKIESPTSEYNEVTDINESNIVIPGEVIPPPSVGRKEGDVEVPESLRKVISDEVTYNGRASGLELAKGFGISPSSVSAYSKGATSTSSYNSPNDGLKTHIERTKDRIVTKTKRKLMMALNHLTDDKMSSVKPRDLAGIAKDMSTIIKNIEPPTPIINNDNGPKFVLYAPRFINEEKLDVIEVKD